MNKKIVIICLILILVVFSLSFNHNDKKITNIVFHVTLADPNLYKNGIYTNYFTIEGGDYLFKFVPNGDSPKILTITIKGENYMFSENFKLIGTLHQFKESSTVEYFTWDYDGQKVFSIPNQQVINIEINPNGNELGPVSVDIIK